MAGSSLVWGARLRRILKGVEELRPHSSFRNKRAPVTISLLEDLNRGLDRSSGLDTCIRKIWRGLIHNGTLPLPT
jgi:hypothetical protein